MTSRILQLLWIVPLLAYYLVLWRWAQNIPFNDDIVDILGFTLSLADAEGVADVFGALLEPHNDHRTSASRLWYALAYQLNGEINFRHLSFLANLSVVALLALFSLQTRGRQLRGITVLSLALLFFQPRAFGPMFFVMCGFAFYNVCLYGVASLTALQRPTRVNFALALLCAVLATFSLASGQMIWPVGLAWLSYRSWRGELNWRYPLGWALATILCLYLYQLGWDKPNSVGRLLALLADEPLFVVRFGLAIAGSAFCWGESMLAELLGMSMLGLLIWYSWRDFRRGLSCLHWIAWYLLAQCFVIALGRAPYAAALDNAMFFALVPRYSFISLTLAAPLLLLGLRDQSRGRRPEIALACTLLFSLLFNLGSYAFYLPQVHAHWEYRLKFYNSGQYQLLGMPLRESNALVERAVARGIYRPPPPPLEAGVPR